MKTFFITANETGVGKTYVMGILGRYFARQGLSVQIIKAIDCGDSHDAETALRIAGSNRVSCETLVRLPAPLAPLAGANLSTGNLPSLPELASRIENLPPADVRLIEGAGGVAVPIGDGGVDWRDLAESINLTATLAVIDNRLGAINQARLVHRYLGDLSHSFILNASNTADDPAKSTNWPQLQALGLPLMASLEPGAVEFTQFDPTFLNLEGARLPELGDSSFERAIQKLEARKAKQTFRRITASKRNDTRINLADNDYLDLRRHPVVAAAAKSAIDAWGSSSSASPLISGYTEVHEALELQISAWYGNRPTLVWNSGYTANQALLKLFLAPGELVLADRLIHNSLISGILQSGARLVRFQHNDLDHLETLLKRFAGSRKVHVVTESVYSMDGDYPDLKQLARLKACYGFNWYLDEAHAIGWYGSQGSGLAEAAGVLDQVDVLTGTLGKALASSGAYTVFQQDWMRDYCINEAGEFIYSTYLPPASASAAGAAIQLVRGWSAERSMWQQRARQFRDKLRGTGFQVLGEDSPIVPVLCGESARAIDLAECMSAAGIRVAAIRPPTVPQGGARLRLSLKSTLTCEDYSQLEQHFTGGVVSHA